MEPSNYDANGPYCPYPRYYPPYYYGYHQYNGGYGGREQAHSQVEEDGGSDTHSSSMAYVYYVRLVQDPKKKSKYVVRQWHVVSQGFNSSDEMKRLLQDAFPDDLPALTSDFYLGYFEPPSGAKRWIIDDRDLQSLYANRDPGSKINLWCEPKLPEAESSTDSGKSSQPAAKKRKGTTRESIELETDSVFDQLKGKHPHMENPKLRLWAKVIQSGHWEDYDNPPPIPLITGPKIKPKQQKETFTDALVGAATAIVKTLQPQDPNTPKRSSNDSDKPKISPMKSATIRRSCLDDLKKLKDLHEDGVLTEEEFQEEKQQILATLRSLK